MRRLRLRRGRKYDLLSCCLCARLTDQWVSWSIRSAGWLSDHPSGAQQKAENPESRAPLSPEKLATASNATAELAVFRRGFTRRVI